MMRNVWVELPPRPTRAESQSPRLFQPGKAQRWEKPQEIERTFPQGFSRYHSWQPAWLWWKEICVIQNNNKLQVEPSLKEKGTIVKKKKSWKIIHQNLYLFSSYATVFEICNMKYKRELQIDSVKRILFFKNLNSLNKKKISLSSVQFSLSVTSNSLSPHGLQHARPPYPSPTPRACSNSSPLSQWCHPTISSSVAPFSCLQSFPASGSFPMSQFFASGGQSIGASASVFPWIFRTDFL